jgi:CheY-like chemotaxis protein
MPPKLKKKTKYPSVMLIDDDQIDIFMNQKMMEDSDFSNTIYTHTSAKSGLEFYKSLTRMANLPTELFPSVILLDMNMPFMDGNQFLTAFENLEPGNGDLVKIVLLTSSTNPVDLEKANSSKYVIKILTKPLTKEHLDSI